MEKEKNIKICAGYIIDKFYYSDIEIKQFLENIATYINQVDKLYIYNLTSNEHNTKHDLIEHINNYSHVEVANCAGFSEAELYAEFYQKAISDEADFAVMLKPGYFYEEDSFNELKRYLLEADTSNLSVITPVPLLACEIHERKAEEYRTILGCRLIGALVNLDIYRITEGICTNYYQTTFDYDYCLTTRSMGYEIMLAQNQAFRNQNYTVITKKIGFITLSTYDRDLKEVYYETRNRLFLWEKFKKIDPKYVALDKKIYKQEKREMFFKDKNYRDKKLMIDKAIEHFEHHIMGPYTD